MSREIQSPISRDSRTIIYQGVLNKDRGLESLIMAMKELDGFTCWLVGEGDIQTELHQMVREHQLEGRVIFKGKILPKTLWSITPKAWIGFNLLAGDSKSYYYSLSNKFFDYMMAGIPSLNMNYPVYKHYIDQFEMGLMVDECSIESILKAIRRLDEQVELYDRLCSNARKAAEVYTWHRESGRLIDIYRRFQQ